MYAIYFLNRCLRSHPAFRKNKRFPALFSSYLYFPYTFSYRLEKSSQKKLESFLKPTINIAEMNNQKKLEAFFKPTTKRVLERTDNLSNSKKTKTNQVDDLAEDSKENLTNPNGGVILDEILAYSEKFKVLDRRIGPSWFKALKNEFDKKYFLKLNEFIESERKKGIVFPPEDHVWSWTRQCSIDSIKVVILGQDPYHNPGQAHGLCFSVPIGIPPPPSLLNMYKELETDISDFKIPKHGYLVGWARQGVLLLNAVLTVRKNAPNSHKDQGWEELTTAVIKYLNEKQKGIVFLLWGSYAQKKADFVDKKKHCVLKTVHPSPLSASRGWFGSKHFSKCNEYLEKVGKRPIDWKRLPEK